MKFLLLPVIFLLCFQFAAAQQPCATTLTNEMKAQLLEYSFHKEEFAASNSIRVIQYVPIKFHIVGRTNGTGHYLLANVWKLLCELNGKFQATGFYFYVYGDIHYIDNGEYFDLDFNSGDEMMNENNVAGATNVYIVNDPAGYCGYYTYGPDALTVAKSCNAPGSTTLAHELGHYFSLPHPFDIVGSQEEYVNGSNCSFAGDLFCDTRADFLDYRWSCPYTGSDQDPLGQVYNPDETLYMSYSFDNCQDKFSNEQMQAMNYNLVFERPDLLNHPAPDVSPITGIPQMNYPIDSVNDIPHDFVELKWEPVEGADFYHVQVTRAPTFGGEPTETDVIVYGTAFTTGLEVDKKYHWRVLGLKNGYTCGTWSQSETFFTVLGTGIDQISGSDEGFSVYPNLVKSGGLLFITLNSLKTGPAQMRLVSVDGKICKNIYEDFTIGENNWKIETDELAAGIYLLNILANGKMLQQKVIISQ